MKVFIIEEELFIRRIFEECLTRCGHEVMTVPNDHDCLHFYKDFEPDILVCDVESLQSPLEDSLKPFVQASQIPVVGLFSQNGEDEVEEAHPLLAASWKKPIEVKSIVSTLEKIYSSSDIKGKC